MIAIGKRDDTIIGRKYRRNRGNSYRPTDLPEGEATKFITFTWEEIVPMGRRKSGKVTGTEAKIFFANKKVDQKIC